MRFGRWLSLAEALAAVPSTPGVFQVRLAQGLLPYPRGMSAMVAYGGGEDLSAALRSFADSNTFRRAAAFGPLLVRLATPNAHEGAAAGLTRLRRRFIEQFGAPPAAELPGGPSTGAPEGDSGA